MTGPAGPVASYAQERFWLLDQLAPGTATLSLPWAFRLTGRLDRGALAQGVERVVRRHDTLRTALRPVAGELRQCIVPPGAQGPVLRSRRCAGGWCAADELLGEAVRVGFDLREGPLFRAELIELAACDHVLLLNVHHSIGDAWSIGLLTDEVAGAYRGLVLGGAPPPPLRLQYADYAAWERAHVGGRLADLVTYWRARLEDCPVLELTTDRPRPAIPDHATGEVRVEVPGPIRQAAARLARRASATLFMVLLGVYQVLLGRRTGLRSVPVGTVASLRTRPGLEALVGCFVNPVILRTDLHQARDFEDVLAAARDSVLGALDHRALPYQQLVRHVRNVRAPGRSPWTEAYSAVESGYPARLDLPGIAADPIPVRRRTAQHDLGMLVQADGARLGVTFVYRSSLFDRATVEAFAADWLALLDRSASRPDRPL